MLLTSGERVSMALLCMALAELGVDAVSYTGSQAGIITDTDHTRAKIVEVKADRLRGPLAEGRVPVVAGFQGVSTERDVTTLGRGGSDMTAVALASRPRRRRLRDLHRRVRGLQRRSPDRPGGAAHAQGELRGDARDRRRAAGASWCCVRSSSPAITACRCTSVPASPGSPAPGWSRRMSPWSRPSSPPSPTTPPRPR